MVTMTAAEAQERFGELLDTAQREPVSITRDGQPAAFLVSEREMQASQRIRQERSDAAKALEAWAESARPHRNPDAEELTDEEIVRLVHELR